MLSRIYETLLPVPTTRSRDGPGIERSIIEPADRAFRSRLLAKSGN